MPNKKLSLALIDDIKNQRIQSPLVIEGVDPEEKNAFQLTDLLTDALKSIVDLTELHLIGLNEVTVSIFVTALKNSQCTIQTLKLEKMDLPSTRIFATALKSDALKLKVIDLSYLECNACVILFNDLLSSATQSSCYAFKFSDTSLYVWPVTVMNLINLIYIATSQKYSGKGSSPLNNVVSLSSSLSAASLVFPSSYISVHSIQKKLLNRMNISSFMINRGGLFEFIIDQQVELDSAEQDTNALASLVADSLINNGIDHINLIRINSEMTAMLCQAFAQKKGMRIGLRLEGLDKDPVDQIFNAFHRSGHAILALGLHELTDSAISATVEHLKTFINGNLSHINLSGLRENAGVFLAESLRSVPQRNAIQVRCSNSPLLSLASHDALCHVGQIFPENIVPVVNPPFSSSSMPLPRNDVSLGPLCFLDRNIIAKIKAAKLPELSIGAFVVLDVDEKKPDELVHLLKECLIECKLNGLELKGINVDVANVFAKILKDVNLNLPSIRFTQLTIESVSVIIAALKEKCSPLPLLELSMMSKEALSVVADFIKNWKSNGQVLRINISKLDDEACTVLIDALADFPSPCKIKYDPNTISMVSKQRFTTMLLAQRRVSASNVDSAMNLLTSSSSSSSPCQAPNAALERSLTSQTAHGQKRPRIDESTDASSSSSEQNQLLKKDKLTFTQQLRDLMEQNKVLQQDKKNQQTVIEHLRRENARLTQRPPLSNAPPSYSSIFIPAENTMSVVAPTQNARLNAQVKFI